MRIIPVLLLSAFLHSAIFAQSNPDSLQPLVFTHVTVIDATGAPPKRDRILVVSNRRIVALGRPGRVMIPKGARFVDATGKYLIPGLWDMHVHMSARARIFIPYFIAYGITGVRDMATNENIPEVIQMRKEIAAGSLLGPRIVIGHQVDGTLSRPARSVLIVGSEAEGRRAVATVKQEGADFVKIYSHLTREAYFAIADEAKKLAIPFVGHLPNVVAAAEASDAGQKSIEHTHWLLLACSSREDQTRRMLGDKIPDTAFLSADLKSADTFDKRKARRLFARFIKNQTWITPTLTELRGYTKLVEQNRDGEYLVEPIARWQKVYSKKLKIVGLMGKAGVGILAGTDTPIFDPPGSSLHDELDLLVKAGLSPMQALQAATVNPAKYLGMQGIMGIIKKGKVADLVLLDANPLADINNTRRVAAVVVDGRLVSREELQRLLDNANRGVSKQ